MSRPVAFVAGVATVGLVLYVFVWRKFVNGFDEQERPVEMDG